MSLSTTKLVEQEPGVERTLSLINGDLANVNEALSWVVRKLDEEFGEVENLSIRIDSCEHMHPESDETIQLWTAFIQGSVEA